MGGACLSPPLQSLSSHSLCEPLSPGFPSLWLFLPSTFSDSSLPPNFMPKCETYPAGAWLGLSLGTSSLRELAYNQGCDPHFAADSQIHVRSTVLSVAIQTLTSNLSTSHLCFGILHRLFNVTCPRLNSLTATPAPSKPVPPLYFLSLWMAPPSTSCLTQSPFLIMNPTVGPGATVLADEP